MVLARQAQCSSEGGTRWSPAGTPGWCLLLPGRQSRGDQCSPSITLRGGLHPGWGCRASEQVSRCTPGPQEPGAPGVATWVLTDPPLSHSLLPRDKSLYLT